MKQIHTKLMAFLLACLLACSLGVAASAVAVEGDVNGDGECTVLDVLLVLQSVLHDRQDEGRDVNGDGKVSLADVIRTLKLTVTTDAPTVGTPESGSASVTVENGTLKEAVSLNGENVSAAVPAGVAVEAGATALTLSVTAMDNTNGNITPGDTETAVSYDVHIDGVAETNTVPIVVDLGAILPVGQNLGTVSLYHVENGTAVKMTQVMSLADLDAHNEFYYYPATGTVFVALATFSEIAIVNDTENAWGGNFDYSWYTETLTPLAAGNTSEYTIANADQLAAFGAIVGGMAKDEEGNAIEADSFEGKIVKLLADINLGDDEKNNNANLIFYPIGYYNSKGTYDRTEIDANGVTSGLYAFKGTFDGAGHTISNIYQNTWEMIGDHDWYSAAEAYYRDGMGLFGKVYGGTVKNLTVNNFSSDGEIATTGVIAAYADFGASFENIAITNCNPRVYNIGNGGIVGCVGWYAKEADGVVTFKNITVDNSNKISALWGSYDVACGGIVGQYYPTSGQSSAGSPKNGGITFTNCHVAAVMDVYNDVCANYQYYAYRYTGMMIGSIRENETIDGHVYPKMDGITAKDCTVHFGDWNDYYYCELVANSLASYTHDHQMSRLTQVASVDVANKTVTDLKGNTTAIPASGRVNYVVVKQKDDNGMWIHGDGHDYAECYHFVDGVQHKHDVADADNPTPTETVNGVEGVLKEDKQLVYREFNQLFTGYGWGVTSKGLTDYEGVENMDIKHTENEESVEKFETKFTGDFLYRVGNQNTVALGSLFTAKDGVTINNSGVYVTVDPVDDTINVSGTFTANTSDWTKGTIQFSGTGPVKVTIQDYDYCTPTVLYLEVVDAYNRTTASFGGNSVLLNDVSTSATLSTSGIVYGNGFTVNMENAPISEKNGAVFHLYDGAVLKNLGIVGKEFTSVAMNVNDTNYGVSAVRAWGTVVIENCYISGCRAAVSVTGTELTIKDSVIANGVYANVDFRSGILNLHNVTTINEPHAVNGTTVVGLGIVGNMTASAGRQLNITGNLTQYNWVSKADCSNIKATGVDSIFNSVFTEDKYAALRYTYNGTTYVNTGILSLCSDFGTSAVSGIPSNYSGMDVSATIYDQTADGYVWAPAQAGTLTAEDMKYHDTVYAWTPNDQGTSFVAPAFNFTKADLEAENGVAQISYESGSSYTLSAETLENLFSATKYGKPLSCAITMDGEDYTDKDIVINGTASKTYTISYTVTDDCVYNATGVLTDKTYNITKDLQVFATVVDKGADAPAFTFYYGTNGSASAGTPHSTQPTNSYTSAIKQVGETYYIMPNVSATTENAIGSQTVDGETVYYPIVDGINVRSGNSTDYDFTRYYPIFKAVTISDNGTEYTYSGTLEIPATVAWVSAEIDSGNGASALNDGFGLYNDQYLCKIQTKAGNAESGGTSVVKFSYTALDGNTYYYYVGYRFYDEDEGGLCVTPDTLVTLADGTQKRVDALTGEEELLVWNHETGTLDTASVAYIVDHNKQEIITEVTALTFSDETVLNIIEEHVFYDATLNKYVAIGADAAQYIGHSFAKVSESGDVLETVQLTNVATETRETGVYEVVSYKHLTCFANGILSSSAYLDPLLNIFDIDPETMAYDPVKMMKDVETYGLYTYEDFDGLVPEEAFEMYNAAYLKIAVGKGYITWEDIENLIDIYFAVNVTPLKD